MSNTPPLIKSHERPVPLPEFLYGSAYYPEHWDEPTRRDDAVRMREAGWNVVRMGEFAWDLLEPEEGKFNFNLFDETIDRLGREGIRTILGTPTAAPPRWLTYQHPEILAMDASGVVLQHGSRQHASLAHPLFREYCRRIVQALAIHFQDNPNVIGWQTDNEIHCHFSEDHSPAVQQAFAEYLRGRYEGNIGALNQAWGSEFWAQTYRSFEEIPTPRHNQPTYANPGHLLDYARCLSNSATLFQRDQVDILRRANSAWFITHNGIMPFIDYRHEFCGDLDFFSADVYPYFEYDPNHRRHWQAAFLDHVRALAGNFLVMEQQSGPGGQCTYLHDTPEPGEMRRSVYTSIARGADGVLLFRWRSCRFGAEEYWCGVLDHDNVPRRRYREAARLGQELKRVGPAVLGTHVAVDIGIACGDYAVEQGHQGLHLGLPKPKSVAERIHEFYLDRGFAVGCLHPDDDLEGLKVFFIPHWSLFDPHWVPALERFVARGGILVVGARTATKEMNNRVVAESLPGVLRSLAGAGVEEYGRQNRPDARPLIFTLEGKDVLTQEWYELLLPDEGTEVLAAWKSRHLKDGAAVTLKRHGAGAVIYVGTYFTPEVLQALQPTLESLGAPKPLFPNKPVTCETVWRQTPDGLRLLFVVNHGEEDVILVGAPAGHDLVSDTPVSGSIRLAPNDVAVIRCR